MMSLIVTACTAVVMALLIIGFIWFVTKMENPP